MSKRVDQSITVVNEAVSNTNTSILILLPFIKMSGVLTQLKNAMPQTVAAFELKFLKYSHVPPLPDQKQMWLFLPTVFVVQTSKT